MVFDDLSRKPRASTPEPEDPGQGSESEGERFGEQEEQRYLCTICDSMLPCCAFPTRKGKKVGTVCTDDQLTIESLQDMKKKEWGDKYKEKWKLFRKDKIGFKMRVMDMRANAPPRGRGIRKTQYQNEVVNKVIRRAKTKHRQRRRRKMTWNQFKDHAMSAAGGSHDAGQAITMWNGFSLQPAGERKSDNRGVYKGKKNS